MTVSRQIPVHQLIPHSGPMVLLDTVDDYQDHSLSVSVLVTKDSLFVEDRGVPAWVGLEYMGQAIAALAGTAARRRGEPVRIGFLVSTRRYEPEVDYFSIGAQLTVTVEEVTGNGAGLRVFECSIYTNGDRLVTANLNVFMPEDVEAYMKEDRE